jgi:hypothetical protein
MTRLYRLVSRPGRLDLSRARTRLQVLNGLHAVVRDIHLDATAEALMRLEEGRPLMRLEEGQPSASTHTDASAGDSTS